MPATTFPVTVAFVKVPTLVILGCAAVVTVPAVVALVALVALDTVPVTLAPAIALRPLPLPVNIPVLAVNATAVTVPLTPSDVRVPTLVIFGWAAVVTVPAVVALVALVALATVPVTFAPAIALRPEPLPVNTPVLAVNAEAVTVPLTPSDVRVPTEVILGCAAVVTVPAVVALVAAPLSAPTKVVAVIEALPKLALMPVLMTALELPFAPDVVNVG